MRLRPGLFVLLVGCGAAARAAPTPSAEPVPVVVPEPADPEPAPVTDAAADRSAEAPATTDPAADGSAEPGVAPPAELALGPVVDIACGRWSAALPEGARFDDEGAEVPGPGCVDPEYPGRHALRNVAGADLETSLVVEGCSVELTGHDGAPQALLAGDGSSLAAAPTIELGPDGGSLAAASTDGGSIWLEVTGDGDEPGCGAVARAVVLGIAGSLRPTPLAGGPVHLGLSSAGHGMDLVLPAGVFAVTLGGMADVFETSYELRAADGHALAVVTTAWDPYGPEEPAPFRARVLRGRLRSPEDGAEVDAWERCEIVAVASVSPDARVFSDLAFCGPASETAATEAIFRAARFTPPRR